jgi:hypothetical protein
VTDFLRRNPLVAAMAGLCAVLVAIIAVELVAIDPSKGRAAPAKAVAAEAKLLPPVASASAESAYPETASRPLWIPTRRPAPPAAVAAQQTMPRDQFVLQGVVMAGPTRIAFLKEKASGRVHRVELGREVNGLHVAEVEAEQVTLTQGAEREVLALRVQRPPTPGPAAPGAQGTPMTPTAGGPMPVVPPQAAVPSQGAMAAAMAAGAANRGGGPFAPQQIGVPMPAPAPGQAAPAGAPANPAAGAMPQQSAAPMTPEELLARRRARRNQTTE